MTDSIINDLLLMKAHFSEGMRLVEGLEKKLNPVPKRKKSGLTDEWKANFRAKRNRTLGIK